MAEVIDTPPNSPALLLASFHLHLDQDLFPDATVALHSHCIAICIEVYMILVRKKILKVILKWISASIWSFSCWEKEKEKKSPKMDNLGG